MSEWQCGECGALETQGGCSHDFEMNYKEIAKRTTMHLMPVDRVTEREGRWYLRSGYLDGTDDTYVAVVSNRAPEGTVARDLRPENIEISTNVDHDPLTLPVDALRDLLVWPPASTLDDQRPAEPGGRERP